MVNAIIRKYPNVPTCCLYIQEGKYYAGRGFISEVHAPLEKVSVITPTKQPLPIVPYCREVKSCLKDTLTTINFSFGKMTFRKQRINKKCNLKFAGECFVIFDKNDPPVFIKYSALSQLRRSVSLDSYLNKP